MRDLTTLCDLKLALIQTHLVWQDAAQNRTRFEQLLEQARGADLIVLPEMFTTGFSMDSAALAEPTDGPSTSWLREQAQKLGAVVTGTLIIQVADGSYRNRLLWARPDGSLAHYDKRHLFRMAGEHLHFRAGDQQALFEVKGWRVRPLICYDLRFPVWSRDPHGTDLLFYTANWPTARSKQWNRLLPARAIENLCYVAGINRIGEDGKQIPYSGDTQVLDYLGDTLANAQAQDQVLQVSLSAQNLARFREKFPAFRDADHFRFDL